MGFQKEYLAHFGTGHRNNVIFTLNAGESMTLDFRNSGTDTTIKKFYNLQGPARNVMIIVSKIATITHINNQELKSPMTLGTDNANSFKNGIEWPNIKLAADSVSTVFEVYAS